MSFLEKNLQALATRNPELAKLIRLLPKVPAFTSATINGEPEILLKSSDGNEFAYHGGESPKKVSSDFLKDLKFKNPRILVFGGAGFGYHLLDYAKQPHPLCRAIIVIEPFPHILREAMIVSDLSSILSSPYFHWFAGQDVGRLFNFLTHFFANTKMLSISRGIEYSLYAPALKLSANFFDAALRQVLPGVVNYQLSRYRSDPFDCYIGYQNTLNNLDLLSGMTNFSNAKDLFKDKPGVIVASGPSLSHSIPFLKLAQSKSVLIACPSALELLIDNGIKPHIWLNIERGETQGAYLEKIRVKPSHIFVGNTQVHSRCFTGNGGLNTFICGDSGLTHWLPLEGPRYDHGHSSAHTAFLLLKELGCHQIFMLGQDLSYSQGRSHGDGVWDESVLYMAQRKKDGKEEPLIELDGYGEKKVMTNFYWNLFLKTFVHQVLPAYSGVVYNVMPPDMGAVIDGTKRIDPSEFLSLLGDDFETYPALEKALQPQPVDAKQNMMAKIGAKKVVAQKALLRLAEYAATFALDCKKFQYLDAVMLKDWTLVEPLYDTFMKRAQLYFNHLGPDETDSEAKTVYQEVLHPLIQGVFLSYQLEYFSLAGEESGNFEEINRKMEILHHLAIDESYWAGQAYLLLK